MPPCSNENGTGIFAGWTFKSKGEPLTFEEYTPKPLGPNDLELDVTHNGLCHTDIHMQHNDWGVAAFPFIPGHEVVGTIVAKGDLVDWLQVGDRVGYGWIKSSCMHCEKCVDGQGNLCKAGYTGLITGGGNGGFQKRMRAPAEYAYKIPEGMPSAEAAPLLCAGNTVYNPLRRLVTRPGMRIGVQGIGGLGHLALQMAAAMGGTVYAISSSPSKAEEAASFGARHFVTMDEVKEKLKATLDILIVTCPCETDYSLQMSLLTTGGALCLLGIPVCDVKVSVVDLVFNQKSVVGSIVAGKRDTQEMLQFCVDKDIRPKIQVMPLSKANEGLKLCAENKARYRIVFETDC